MYTCKGSFHTTAEGEIKEKQLVAALFKSLPKGSRFRIILEEFQERSTPMNDYYWRICADYLLPALRDAGHSEFTNKDQVHAFIKKKFKVDSTQLVNNNEMQHLLELVYQWAAEYLNIALPSPNSKENFI